MALVQAVVQDILLHDEVVAAADVDWQQLLSWSPRVQHRLAPAARQVGRTPTTLTTQKTGHNSRLIAVYPGRGQTLWSVD